MKMKRRDFITLLSGAAAWPLAARAQQSGLPVIGYVSLGSPGDRTYLVSAFQDGLNSAGYVDRRNVEIEYRWAQDQSNRLPAMFSELTGRNVAAIFTSGNVALRLAKSATTQFQSSSILPPIRSRWVMWPASTGQAGI
jgi:putative tryptophan/tyrosine transport system substrate-binding protein